MRNAVTSFSVASLMGHASSVRARPFGEIRPAYVLCYVRSMRRATHAECATLGHHVVGNDPISIGGTIPTGSGINTAKSSISN